MDAKDIGFVSFTCAHCHTEIEASSDMVGQEAECPACGMKFTVPDGTSKVDDAVRHTAEDDNSRTQAIKSRTIRIELGDL